MHFSILGPLEVRGRDVHITIRRGRPRNLVHLLLLNRRVVLPTDVIADRLWPDDLPQDVPNAVHQVVSYLRRALGVADREVLTTTPAGYLLDLADADVDAWTFERLLSEALDVPDGAHYDQLVAACAAADQAITLWRGDPFSESAHFEWTAGVRTRLQDGYLEAQLSRLDVLLRLGRHRAVVLDAQALGAAYPLREDFHHQHALALYRSGRQSEALNVLRDVRGLLARELGVDPGRGLRDLERDILQQEEHLEWTPPRTTIVGGGSSAPGGGASEAPTGTLGSPTGTEAVRARHALADPPPLARPSTALIGRTEELASLGAIGTAGSLVTVTGPAGVGKTRLLLEMAARIPRRTWVVDLTAASTDEDVVLMVAQSLVPSYAGTTPLPVLASALADLDGNVVLDGCEHVIAGVRDLLAAVRRPDGRASFWVGSRRPCDAADERVLRLAALDVPPAGTHHVEALAEIESVRLFIDRATLAQASFAPGPAELSLLAEVVRAVDGLPLAIELAASLLEVEPLPAIRDRLETQLGSMPHARFSLPTRERTLASAIDASASALDAAERRLLVCLGVFAGPFDLAGAAAVADLNEAETYPGLAALVRQSLVASPGGSGFQLLAPVRAWARNALWTSPDGGDDVRRRYAVHVCDRLWAAWRETGGLRHRNALHGVASSLPDARAALAWALETREVACAIKISVACSWVWTLQGKGEDGLAALQEVQDLADAHGVQGADAVELRASLLRCIGLVANPVGRLTLAARVCTEAADLYRQIGDRDQEAAAMLTLGIARWAQGDSGDARHAMQAALDLTAHDPASWHHVAAQVLLARTLLDQGADEADAALDRALEVARAAGDPHLHGLALACRARWFVAAGEPATAVVAAQEAARLWRGIDYVEGEIMAENLLARAGLARGLTNEAWAHARRALATSQTSRHRGGMCESVESLALTAAALGRREQALLLLEVASRERRRLGAPVPAGDRAAVEDGWCAMRRELAGAADLVATRAALTGLDDLVTELVAGLMVDSVG